MEEILSLPVFLVVVDPVLIAGLSALLLVEGGMGSRHVGKCVVYVLTCQSPWWHKSHGIATAYCT